MNTATIKQPPSAEEMQTRYQRACQLEEVKGSFGDFNKKCTLNTIVHPHWITGSDSFWYERETPAGKHYRRVDAAAVTNSRAFDHHHLAKHLAEASGQSIDADNLPISRVDMTLTPHQLSFTAFDQPWCFNLDTGSLQKTPALPSDCNISPDGRKAAFVRDNNLWLRDLTTGTEQALTEDGEKFYVYAATSSVYGRQEAITVEALWSEDSSRLLTLVRDTRNVKIGPPLVQYVPEDGSLRPKIVNPDRRLGLPGDEHIEVNNFLAIHISSGQIQRADYRSCPAYMPPYIGFFTGRRGWWSNDNRHAYFTDLERGGHTARLLEFDTHTGNTRVVIEDKDDARITLIPLDHLHTLIVPLLASKEVIWFSERSGWAHLYLYDIETGQLKNPITQGEWLVRSVLHFDHKRRELWIRTAGRTAGRNPYYCDICRVNIDTGALQEVRSSDHEYVVCDARSRPTFGAGVLGVAPDGDYVVTSRSRVDQLPVTLLLDRNGKS